MSYRPASLFLRLCCVVAALSLALAPGVARAIDYRWIADTGGWFDYSSSWDQGAGHPGPNDRAIFDIYATYPVWFYQNETSRYLEHDLGSVTFDLNTYTYTITSSTYLGYNGSDWGRVYVQDGNVSSSTVYLGYSESADGGLTVSTGGAWTSSGNLYVGYQNETTGDLDIENGGSVSASNIYIGAYDDSAGSVYMSGATSELVATSALRVGYYARGTLNVYGGSIESVGGYVGYGLDADATQGAYGHLYISGADSSWTNTGSLYVGYTEGASGSMEIGYGASVSNTYCYIGCLNGAEGSVHVSGTDAQWTNSSNLYVGYSGKGDLRIDGSASVSNTSGYVGSNSGSEGAVTVSGTGSQWTNTSSLYIGNQGSGSLEITSGGSVSNTYGYVALSEGSNGTVTISGSNSGWTNTYALFVGYSGSAVLDIANGATVSNTYAEIGETGTGYGEVNISDNGSNWNNSSYLVVGYSGTGVLNITNGADVSDTTGYIGIQSGGRGEVTVSGTGSAWHNSDSLYVGGDSYGTGGSGSVTVGPGGTVQVSSTLRIWDAGTVNLCGGTIEAGTLVMAGSAFYFTAGTLRITNSDLYLDDGEPLGTMLDLASGMHVDVTEDTYVEAPALLRVGGGASFETNMLVNSGEVQVDGPTAVLSGSSLVNHGLLTGDGQIHSTLYNQSAGEVRGQSGRRLRFTGAGNGSYGEINLGGGTIEFSETLINQTDGFIAGRGELRVEGGLTNDGTMAFSGGFTDVYGDVANSATGQITISGGSTTTFYDDVATDGEIRVSTACAAVFFGDFTGTGGTTGPGTVYLEGDLRPGSSPAVVSFGGDVALGNAATVVIELYGTEPGEFDVVDVADTLSLDGTLDVRLMDAFTPALGDRFDVFDWSARDGTFDAVLLPGLESYMRWDTGDLYVTGELAVTYLTFPGDANLDGVVDDEDASIVGAHWMQSGSWGDGDFNGDTVVNDKDAAILAAYWGATAEGTTPSVPEPGALATLLVGAAMLLMRRRR